MTEFDDSDYDDISEWLQSLTETDESTDHPECDACDRAQYGEEPLLHEVDLAGDAYEVCERCLNGLRSDVEDHYWYDRLDEAHYDRAAEYLRNLDEVWCVKDHGYPGGEMWLHTPFCNAAVVNDVVEHFSFRIRWFSVVYPDDDHVYDCVHDHGPCIEINLDYPSNADYPFPLEYDIAEDRSYSDTEFLNESDRLFDRDDE